MIADIIFVGWCTNWNPRTSFGWWSGTHLSVLHPNYHGELWQLEICLQDSEWEDAEADDVSNDENLLHSVNATSVGRHTHEYLQVMAKVYDGVCSKHNEFHLFWVSLMCTSLVWLLLLSFQLILILQVYISCSYICSGRWWVWGWPSYCFWSS